VPVGVAGASTPRPRPGGGPRGRPMSSSAGAITKALDPAAATQEIRRALDEGVVIPTTFFKRGGAEEIRRVLSLVSAANLSGRPAPERVLEGLRPLARNASGGAGPDGAHLSRRLGQAVEAIDLAQPGDVLVVDAGRGAGHLGRTGHPFCPPAGSGRGWSSTGPSGTPGTSSSWLCRFFPPGDAQRRGTQGLRGDRHPHPYRQTRKWKPGTGPGRRRRGHSPPQKIAVEYANRAMDVLEKENRIREEIKEGAISPGDRFAEVGEEV